MATVAVKQAKDRFAAQLVPVAESRAAIEEAARVALRASPATPTVNRTSHRLTVRWQNPSVANHLPAIPGVTRTDDRTVTVDAPMPDLYRLFNLFLRVATAITSNPPYC